MGLNKFKRIEKHEMFPKHTRVKFKTVKKMGEIPNTQKSNNTYLNEKNASKKKLKFRKCIEMNENEENTSKLKSKLNLKQMGGNSEDWSRY